MSKTVQTNLQECLAEVIDNRGVTPHKRNTEWQDFGIPVYSANNIKTTGLQNLDTIRYIPEKIYSSWMKTPLEKGDILLTSEAPAGEVYYWDSNEKIVVGQRLYGLKVKDNINSKYLKYYLQSSVGQKAIQTQQSGSTVFGISAKTFPLIKVFLPGKDEQDKIGNLLYSIDSNIALNNKINENLQQQAKLLYDYWFNQFEFPNEEEKPYKSSGGKMVWNEELKREIPEGWEVKELADLIIEKNKSTIQTKQVDNKGDVPFFTSGESVLLTNDYLVEGFNCYLSTGGNANVKMYNGNASYSTDTWCITSKEEHKYLLALYLKSIEPYLDIKFFAGTGLKHLQKPLLKKELIVIPSENILGVFNTVISNQFIQISKNTIENNKLSQLRDWLLKFIIN